MSILFKYNKNFINDLEILIYKHFYIQQAPSLYSSFNEKRNIQLLNTKRYYKRSYNYRFKPYHNSKKKLNEYFDF